MDLRLFGSDIITIVLGLPAGFFILESVCLTESKALAASTFFHVRAQISPIRSPVYKQRTIPRS